MLKAKQQKCFHIIYCVCLLFDCIARLFTPSSHSCSAPPSVDGLSALSSLISRVASLYCAINSNIYFKVSLNFCVIKYKMHNIQFSLHCQYAVLHWKTLRVCTTAQMDKSIKYKVLYSNCRNDSEKTAKPSSPLQ